MNTVFILMDSLNRHYLEAYGCKDVKSPNITHLAQRGVTFTNHIIGSAPCMPARRELMSGRREFLWRGWGHMEPFDRHVAARCRQAGAATQMITDHYHYWENNAHGYIEHFNGYEMIRGHELDPWNTTQIKDEPEWVQAINKWRPGWGSKYYRNAAGRKGEEDWPSVQTLTQAAKWLDDNGNHFGPMGRDLKSRPIGSGDGFTLWVETFDPHEPHHCPEPYKSMYCSESKGFTCWPPYQNEAERVRFFRETSLDELAWIRAQYQGKLTMADKALGKVWAVMDKHKLWDNTMVILTTDHGHDLAESVTDLSQITDDGRDATLRIPYAKQHPHYMSHANIPLIVWHPELANKPRQEHAMTTAVDLYSTLLESCGCEETSSPHGESIFPILRGESKGRDFHYWGTFAQGACCTDGEYVLSQGWEPDQPLYAYSYVQGGGPDAEAGKYIPGVDWPVWRTPRGKAEKGFPSILYRRDDPVFREKNVIAEKPEIAEKLRKKLREVLTKDGCPAEQFDRLGI
jgi:arylsulfatase A-like enzyme